MFDVSLFIFRHFSLGVSYLLSIQWPNKAASAQLGKAPVRSEILHCVARSLSQETGRRLLESGDRDTVFSSTSTCT